MQHSVPVHQNELRRELRRLCSHLFDERDQMRHLAEGQEAWHVGRSEPDHAHALVHDRHGRSLGSRVTLRGGSDGRIGAHDQRRACIVAALHKRDVHAAHQRQRRSGARRGGGGGGGGDARRQRGTSLRVTLAVVIQRGSDTDTNAAAAAVAAPRCLCACESQSIAGLQSRAHGLLLGRPASVEGGQLTAPNTAHREHT